MTATGHVSLSVVIPVRNDSDVLRGCLQAIRASTVLPLEIIVVDDCSEQRPDWAAEEFGTLVIRLSQPSGPATARNAGARLARGDVLVFIDADVYVYPDALQRMQRAFEADSRLDALFGSYQERAGADNFISRFKNFQHHFVHQTSRTEAWTFWSGCGAVRRRVFLGHGGFCTSYRRPAVEDIEFGMRLFRAGGKLRLDGRIQATHMKRWTFVTLLRADVLGRAAPWTELLLQHRPMPDDLNLRWTQRLSVVLSVVLLAAVIGGCIRLGSAFMGPIGAALFLLVAPYWSESVRIGRATGATLILGGGLLLLTVVTRQAGASLIVPPVLLAYALVLLRMRVLSAHGNMSHRGDQIVGLYIAAVMALVVAQLPRHWMSAVVTVIVAAVVWLNRGFYKFLCARWGYLNALSVVPFHLIYYLSSAAGFALGAIRYAVALRRPSVQPASRTAFKAARQ